MVVMDRFQNELAELVFPQDTFLLLLHQLADQFEGFYTVV